MQRDLNHSRRRGLARCGVRAAPADLFSGLWIRVLFGRISVSTSLRSRSPLPPSASGAVRNGLLGWWHRREIEGGIRAGDFSAIGQDDADFNRIDSRGSRLLAYLLGLERIPGRRRDELLARDDENHCYGLDGRNCRRTERSAAAEKRPIRRLIAVAEAGAAICAVPFGVLRALPLIFDAEV